jgi:hypothetical protein
MSNEIKIEKTASKVKSALTANGKKGKQVQVDHQIIMVGAFYHAHADGNLDLLRHAVMVSPANWRKPMIKWICEQANVAWDNGKSVFKWKVVSTFRTDPFDANHLADTESNAWFNVEKADSEVPQWLIAKVLKSVTAKLQKNEDDAVSQIQDTDVQKAYKDLQDEMTRIKKMSMKGAKKAA